MAKRAWTVDEIITKALLDNVLYGSADGESADDLTKLAVKDQSGAGSYALEIKVTETLTADRALTITVNNAARGIDKREISHWLVPLLLLGHMASR